MDQAIAQAVPDRQSRRLGPDFVSECAEINVVLQDHVDELRVEPEPAEPEPVDGRPADQVADARLMHAGILVGDDDRSAGTRDPAHLAQGRDMIFVVGEPADRVAGVERRVREGEAFSLGPGQPPSGSGIAIAASQQLCPRDVHTVDSPGWRQEPEVLTIANANLQHTCLGAMETREMPEDRHPSPPGTSLKRQEKPFPLAKAYPAWTVIESRDDAVAAAQRGDRLGDVVASRINTLATGTTAHAPAAAFRSRCSTPAR